MTGVLSPNSHLWLDGGWSNHPEQPWWSTRRPEPRWVLLEQSGAQADQWRSGAGKAEGNDNRCREMTNRRKGFLAFTHLCWCSLDFLEVVCEDGQRESDWWRIRGWNTVKRFLKTVFPRIKRWFKCKKSFKEDLELFCIGCKNSVLLSLCGETDAQCPLLRILTPGCNKPNGFHPCTGVLPQSVLSMQCCWMKSWHVTHLYTCIFLIYKSRKTVLYSNRLGDQNKQKNVFYISQSCIWQWLPTINGEELKILTIAEFTVIENSARHFKIV